MPLNCTTTLEAVNLCLECIGEQPVNTVPTTGVSEATVAKQVVDRTSREIQNMSLHCNTEYDYPFLPNTQGYVELPTNILDIDACDPSLDIVVRGTRLYNKSDRTFDFSTKKQVLCNVTWHLPFEDLPEHVRHYVAVKAARTFQRNYLGSTNLNTMSAEDEHHALINFRRSEDRADDRTMLDTPQAVAILRRRY